MKEVETEKEILLRDFTAGFDKDLLINPENCVVESICPICHLIFNEPVLDSCNPGHTFCEGCIKPKPNRCPMTNLAYQENSQFSKNLLVKSLISKFETHCFNKNACCQWVGLIDQLTSHIYKKCQFETIKCQNKDCKAEVKRGEKAEHQNNCQFRKSNCEFCCISLQFFQKEKHYQSCSKSVLDCPNKCGFKYYPLISDTKNFA